MEKYRGSEWNKWDLHLHTASSYDYKYKGDNADDLLIQALKDNSIKAVAITDHFVIDVERISKLKQLAKDIVFFPGVELRTDKGATNVHVILIFSSITKEELEILCEDFDVFKRSKANNPDDNDKIYWDFKDICEFAKEHNAIISIHAGNKDKGIDDMITNALPINEAIKEEYANNIDIFEMGTVKDCYGYIKNVFPDIKMKKPMVIGSDNHNPKEYKLSEKTTWIKADITFEGLKQVLYEPEERVRIQKNKPDEKADYQIIDSVKYIKKQEEDLLFQEQEIYLNKNLNCIIGGKSTGKSIFLFNLARSIDSNEVKEKQGDNSGKLLLDFDVKWDDGTNEDRKIVYIPQGYLINIFKDNKKDKVNEQIEKFLMEKPDIKATRELFNKKIEDTKETIKRSIKDYKNHLGRLSQLEYELKTINEPDFHIKEIEKLNEQLQKYNNIGVKNDDIDNYTKLKIEQDERKNRCVQIENSINEISQLMTPEVECASNYKEVELLISKINAIVAKEWENGINLICIEKREELKMLRDLINDKEQQISALEAKVNELEGLKIITKSITDEKEMLIKSQKLKENIDNEKEIISKCLNDIDVAYNKYNDIFIEYKERVETIVNNERQSEMKFDVKIENTYLKEDIISNMLDKRNFSSMSQTINLYKDNERTVDNIKKIQDGLENILSIKIDYTIEDVLEYLYDIPYEITYDIITDCDSLYNVSEGKKAKILLDLIIKLSVSKCPILIDQPEDDLDNRSIYKDLVEYIKDKKKERQIIIVTHNANLVIGADSEEIIIANQNSENSKNEKYRFEYITGSIEKNDTIDEKSQAILKKENFRKQVCDILEGGKEAFVNREIKYNLIHK